MLSEKSRPVIEATLSLVAERMPKITPDFYRRMFAARPDLLDGMFSRSSQLEGSQPLALANSIVIFAEYILNNPDKYPEQVLARVAHKHASLGLQEDEYPTVYTYLFEAIAADLGEACTPEVAEAWTEVYWLMAHALITIEKGLYAEQANNTTHAPFRLVERRETGDRVAVLTFEPADSTPLTTATAGQYITLITEAEDGLRQPRQYTLLPSEKNQRRVAIKLDFEGEMTKRYHALHIGDTVEISNPYGDMTLGSLGDDHSKPLYLFSAGIGATPMIAFLAELVNQKSHREVVAVHADRCAESWPLRQEMSQLVEKLKKARLISFLEDTSGDFEGHVDISRLNIPTEATVYLCGPLGFMKNVRSQLVEAGIPGEQIYYEIFGPDQWMLRDTARV